MNEATNKLHKLSAAGVLITLGIIYGDIGTSPIYVMRAIVGGHTINKDIVLGGLSCVIWTLFIITTFKYVYLALNADNKGEGGIFALYALVRRYKVKWAILPALLGCAALIADGFITPPISISSAIEGLTILNPDIPIVPIVIIIISALFIFQQFGTQVVGTVFGPIMTIWFLMIGTLGLIQIVQNPSVLWALNPMYAINLLVKYPGGFWILGAVFLCTTGAEAMFSDLGHCGKKNIRIGWVFVLSMLLLCYFGQASWLMQNEGTFFTEDTSPFYAIMPEWFLPIGIIVASAATIIASQAVITGCFTLVNEATKLKLWTNFKVVYPSNIKGQIYIPAINWFLYLGCITVVLVFRESKNMEAAYGLTITIDMIMTTLLLTKLLQLHRRPWIIIILFLGVFLTIELCFLSSNLLKLSHGGWFTVLIASIIFMGTWLFYKGRILRNKHIEFIEMKEFIPLLKELMKDETVPKEATNLVYLSMVNDANHIDSNILYSVFRKKPKRADVYWFVHVDITNDPYKAEYQVQTLIPKACFFVRLRFGFKVEHKVNYMFSKIVSDLVASGEVDTLSRYPSLRKFELPADFKFIVVQSRIAIDDKLSPWEQFVVKGYRIIKKLGISTAEDFGLEQTNMVEESVPIRVGKTSAIDLKRIP